MANGPCDAPCSDHTSKILDEPQIRQSQANPASVGAENQGTVGTSGLLPREAPLHLKGPRILSLSVSFLSWQV